MGLFSKEKKYVGCQICGSNIAKFFSGKKPMAICSNCKTLYCPRCVRYSKDLKKKEKCPNCGAKVQLTDSITKDYPPIFPQYPARYEKEEKIEIPCKVCGENITKFFGGKKPMAVCHNCYSLYCPKCVSNDKSMAKKEKCPSCRGTVSLTNSIPKTHYPPDFPQEMQRLPPTMGATAPPHPHLHTQAYQHHPAPQQYGNPHPQRQQQTMGVQNPQMGGAYNPNGGMPFCGVCNRQMRPDSVFCDLCGRRIR